MINKIWIPGYVSEKLDGTVGLKIDDELLQSYLKELLRADCECEIEICVTRVEDKKTNPQLKYFFGVILPIVKEAFEDMQGETISKDDTVQFLKEMYFFEERTNPVSGKQFKELGSLEKGSKRDVSKFISKVIVFAETILSVKIPDSAKYKLMSDI